MARRSRVQAMRWKIARRHLYPRRTHRLRWILASTLAVLLLLSGAGGVGAWYWTAHLPSAAHFHIHYSFEDARIYDSRGDLLYNMADLSKRAGRRIVEPLQARNDGGNACRGGVNRIPLLLQNATIATEDATFYKNPGFDPMSIARAFYQNLTYGHIVSGASTITQQVVRAANLVNHRRTFDRKAQEVALAYELSRRFSKRKILWYYLNTVPYGNVSIGAQAAAQTYFQSPVCKLDLAQAAFLAGLPRAPSDYDPVRHRAAALTRMRTVLDALRKHRYIRDRAALRHAWQEAQGWHFSPPRSSMRYSDFVLYAINQVKAVPRLRNLLYQGIDVYTTLDPRLQDQAQQQVTKRIDRLTVAHRVTDGALVSLDLRARQYGWILAMVGGAHLHGPASQVNMAITPRQPGSSMKPFNYIWAFTNGGVGPGTTVKDSPVTLPDPNDTQHGGWYAPKNYDHRFRGTVTMRQALANSLNVPAVKLEYYVTKPANVARTAARFGMTSLYRDNPGLDCSVCYAVTLGGLSKGTRLLEETAAYGTFATGGWTVPPVAIWKVVQRRTGKVLFCSAQCPSGVHPDAGVARARHQVVDPSHAFEMTDVLSDNNARCTPQVCEFGLNSPLVLSRPAAAKTGTTNDFTDNWTVGYTPQIVTGVWAGNADSTHMVNVIGVTGAAPIWHDFMESAFRTLKLPVQQFVAPLNVGPYASCSLPRGGYRQATTFDLFVTDGSGALPLCALPDKGFLPVPCNRYPATILPIGWHCPSAPRPSRRYRYYTYRLGPQGQRIYTYHY